MQSIDKIYYINLERRRDRKEHFLNISKKHGFPEEKIERFDAFDNKTHQFDEEILSLFKNADYLQYPYCNAVICNQMSHFTIMKNMIENDYQNILVFQDDVILREGFTDYVKGIMEKISKDAEMINLGMHEKAFYNEYIPWDLNSKNDDSRIAEEIINPYLCKLEHHLNPCSLSYILTKQGAKNMVRYFEKYGFRKCTDHAFNDYLKNNDLFYSSRKILATSAIEFGSDIF